ncbi:MAG: sucrose phosphorylase [Lachnospiraceae bacterium]|nr:sucrose phosphorylase [Lachnospiraceae bacterium]
MDNKKINEIANTPIPANIPTGDMPGDKIIITPGAIKMAGLIFPRLYEEYEKLGKDRCVISVYGGSGSGKSSISSVLAYMFSLAGIRNRIISGDNYPRRIPSENDAERLSRYNAGGVEALASYIGSPEEIDFDEINGILEDYVHGSKELTLKRMGRDEGSISHEKVDVSDTQLLIIEWTHGNSVYLKHIDIPVFLSSTPEETLANRVSRGRDPEADSPFVALVLDIEQKLLLSQAGTATLIAQNDGTVIKNRINILPMLNAYPDSVGGKLSEMVKILQTDDLHEAFGSFYILPSLYHSDLDRGFSVIDYDLNEELAASGDLDALKDLGIDLKLDFILNHASVQSPQFQDLLANGEKSEYADFFINWNKFWDGYGQMTDEGYIKPDDEYIKDMFFRKPGLPILMVRMPDGRDVPYWNTFYQEIRDNGGKREYLGQMDLNIESPLVWDFYKQTLDKIAGYGAGIVRLDAFAYAPKAPGRKNFLNEPETWDVLSRVTDIASGHGLKLLPEIHATYGEKIHEKIASKGYMTYDFYLPGLLIHSIEKHDPSLIVKWANEIVEKKMNVVNMLGCHDGIPVLDLKGLLSEDEIAPLIDLMVSRGGYVKDLHGKKNMYYQVNSTYYSALGEDDAKMLFARAIQLFMPGKPQIWYLDLFAGSNDYEAVKRAGAGGHKEINRTNLSLDEARAALEKDVVKKQIELLKMRASHPAFSEASTVTAQAEGSVIKITWKHGTDEITLSADFADYSFRVI